MMIPAGRTGFNVSIWVARSEARTVLGVLGLGGLLMLCARLFRDRLVAWAVPFPTATDLGRGLFMTRQGRLPDASRRYIEVLAPRLCLVHTYLRLQNTSTEVLLEYRTQRPYRGIL